MESLRACAPYLASTPELEWYIVADVAVRDLIGLIEGSISRLRRAKSLVSAARVPQGAHSSRSPLESHLDTLIGRRERMLPGMSLATSGLSRCDTTLTLVGRKAYSLKHSVRGSQAAWNLEPTNKQGL